MAYNSTVRLYHVTDGDDRVYLCDEYNFDTISGAFFILIFIFSLAGNSLLLSVLIIYENLKNVTNLFIINLACSDLIFTVTLPFWGVYQLHHWVFGEVACKLMTTAYLVGLYSSIILLTAMTVDRFITVVLHTWTGNSVSRQRFAMVACAAAWVISAGASVSDVIKVKVEHWEGVSRCEDPSDEPDVRLGYYLQVSLLFFLPLAIIVFCYSAILKTVLQASNRKRYRTVVVVLCIVAAFFICWGPYNILLFVGSLYEPKTCAASERLESAYHICRIIAYSHCCMNPLLYMHSPKLRRHLFDLLRCLRPKGGHRERGTGHGSSGLQNIGFNAQMSVDVAELQSR